MAHVDFYCVKPSFIAAFGGAHKEINHTIHIPLIHGTTQ